MLAQTLIFIVSALGDLFAFALITRFLLQWVRAPARNQLSEFVAALTNFIVIPARRFVPGLWGLDLATLLLALLTEALKLWLMLEIKGAQPGAAAGAVAGFLWWNAAPARIFMGDTGALALGGLLGALAIVTNTQLLLAVLGGLFVIETASVIAQVIAFRGFGRRVFRMSPIHHHFELLGWPEFTVIVRFWIIGGILVAIGIGLFYTDFIARGGLG